MIAPARRAAFDALLDIAGNATDLGGAVARARVPLEDRRDRALLLELVAGTERMRAALDYQLAKRSARPLPSLDLEVLTVLRLAAFQLLYLQRVPASAVVNDAVALIRQARFSSATGLVNAVLRSLSRQRTHLQWPEPPAADAPPPAFVRHLAIVHSHPEWLVERWLARHGLDATTRWLEFNNHAPLLCLAVNAARTSREALAASLAREGVETTPTAVSTAGLVVSSGDALASRAFQAGDCLVQDEASQLVVDLVSARAGSRVLDLCASPGGKSVRISSGVGPTGLVVACDVRSPRLALLASTLARCHASAAIVHVASEGALPFRAGAFDEVFIDAPCSGLGTIRRDPDIRWKRTPTDLAGFARTQSALLERAAGLVRPDGGLVYSTCSSEPEENEEVIDAFLTAHQEFSLQRRHHTWPFNDGLEAFFGAVLHRRSV